MTFDTHAHVFVRGLALAEHCRYVPDYDATPGRFLTHLDNNGIDVGLLVQPSFLGTDNHFMLNALRDYPTRFRGVAVVKPGITRTELDDMARLGVVGIRLNLIGTDLPDLTTPEWQSLLTHVRDLGWHVELHRAASDLPDLIQILLDINVKIVIDHYGLPSTALKQFDPGFQFLLEKAASKKIWVKLSGAYRNGGIDTLTENVTPLIPLLLKHFGAERLLWGSDWPHTRFEKNINYQRVFDAFAVEVTDEKTRNKILSASAEALLRA